MRRELHPLTMWISLSLLACATVIANNSVFCLAIVGGASLLVWLRTEDLPWSGSFWWSLRFAALLLLFRAVTGIVIGVPIIGRTLFTLPRIHLPEWMPGIRIGGPVTYERLTSSLHEGLIIATVICLFGAANSLTSPHRLLKVAPIAIYEIALTLIIATSLFPQLIAAISRTREAQKLRGVRNVGVRSIAIPVLEDALARSLNLAESMDSRGFGTSRARTQLRPIHWRPIDALFIAGAVSIAAPAVFL